MEFYKGDQECGICLETLPGTKFFLLTECNHHVCKECMREHCQLLVKDGTVQKLSCPSYKCTSGIPPSVLKEVLTEEQFTRYEALALQNALDVMKDVTYCPRCNSVVIGEPEEDLNLGHCLACFYSFCVDCQDKWHPGEICKHLIEEKNKIKKEGLMLKGKNKNENAEQIRIARQEREIRASYAYVKKMSSKCPSCSSRIMKMSGCNKVTCSVCNNSMCWVCNQKMDSYQHFSDNPKCNYFTWDETREDNADLAGKIVYNTYIYRPVRLPPPPRPVNTGRIIADVIKNDPTLKNKLVHCPSCRQNNMKDSNSNHFHCWNCKASLCFHCKQKIVGPVGRHYKGVNSCPQHT